MGDTTNRLAGIASVWIDGVTYMLVGDLSYSCSTAKRESLAGQSGVQGYSEMPVAPFISATLRDSAELSLVDINGMTNVTVVCELANGKTVTGRNMWIVDVQEVKTQEATFEVRFETFDTNGSVTDK